MSAQMNSVRALKETHSIDIIQQLDLIHSSHTTRLDWKLHCSVYASSLRQVSAYAT